MNGSNVEEIEGSVILFMLVILDIKMFQHIDMILSNGIMDIDDNVDIVKWISNFERIHHCGLIGYLY